jgi:hypothetical protein
MNSDTDYDSEASSMDIEGGSISSDNTDDASMRSASPASVEPITDDREFFREENGRLFNNLSPIYFFPADDEEMDRLGKCGVWYENCY